MQVEQQLQPPGVTATAEHGRRHAASPPKDGFVAVHGDVKVFRFCTIIVERAVHDVADVLLARLPHTGHMYQNEIWGVHLAQHVSILGYHRLVHTLVECVYLLPVIHHLSG